MKQKSVSSVLAERRRQRAAITPSRHNVLHVESNAGEIDDDPSPEETAEWIPVGRGPKAIFAKPSKEQLLSFWNQRLAAAKAYAKIDPDLRKIFKTDRAVNAALRNYAGEKRRKSA